MKQEPAMVLVDGISRRPGGIVMDEARKKGLAEHLNGVIRRITEDTTRFHVELPFTSDYWVSVDESGMNHTIYFRRVLVNANAKHYSPTLLKRWQKALSDKLHYPDSDVMARRLREDPDLVAAMLKCDIPYSLLGRFKTVDYESRPEEITEGPFLVIPGADIGKIVAFESRYQRDGKVRRFLSE